MLASECSVYNEPASGEHLNILSLAEHSAYIVQIFLHTKISKEIKEIPTPISFAMADFDYWRKKNNLPADSKIFILIGGYPDVKKALLDRGI